MSTIPAPTASTSATPPTQVTSGQCVVCGVETSKKCSACSKQGLDWMYFCSEDHQKLVWFMHKRVCGERSNPFQWPPLSKAEVIRCVEVSYVYGPSLNCWFGQWSHGGHRVPANASGRAAFRKMLEDASEMNPSTVDSEMVVSHRINSFRFESLARLKQRQDVDRIALSILKSHPFNFLAYHLDRYYHSKSSPIETPSLTSWSTTFLHRYLIYISVLIKHLDAKQAPSSYVDHAYSELKKFSDEVVKKDQPEFFKIYDLQPKGSVGFVPWSPIEGHSTGQIHFVVRSVPNVPEAIAEVGHQDEIEPFTSSL